MSNDATDQTRLSYPSKMALMDAFENDMPNVRASLGGEPFAIICPKGQLKRWRRLADYLGLMLFESAKVGRETRDDSMVLIHQGEVLTWLPNLRA